MTEIISSAKTIWGLLIDNNTGTGHVTAPDKYLLDLDVVSDVFKETTLNEVTFKTMIDGKMCRYTITKGQGATQ